jgi:hypothetical protein
MVGIIRRTTHHVSLKFFGWFESVDERKIGSKGGMYCTMEIRFRIISHKVTSQSSHIRHHYCNTQLHEQQNVHQGCIICLHRRNMYSTKDTNTTAKIKQLKQPKANQSQNQNHMLCGRMGMGMGMGMMGIASMQLESPGDMI